MLASWRFGGYEAHESQLCFALTKDLEVWAWTAEVQFGRGCLQQPLAKIAVMQQG